MRKVMAATCLSMALTASAAAAGEAEDLELRKQRAETEAAELALEKAKAEFQASQVTLPASGYTGAVEMGEKAGLAESLLLADRALDTAAKFVAAGARKACSGAKTFVLYVGDERPNKSELEAFKHVANNLTSRFAAAIGAAKPGPKPAAGWGVQTQSAGVVTAVTAGLSLLSYFKTDYSLDGAKLDLDQQLFGRLVARELLAPEEKLSATEQKPSARAGVIFYGAYDPAPLNTTPIDALSALAKSAQEATKLANAKGVSAEHKAELQGVVDDLAAFEKALSTPDANGMTPLLRIQRQATLSGLEDICSLNVNVHHVAGSHYTKRNIATGFGAMPFYASAMTTTSYRAWDAAGNLTGVGVFPVDQPFVAFNKIHPKSR